MERGFSTQGPGTRSMKFAQPLVIQNVDELRHRRSPPPAAFMRMASLSRK